MKSNVLPLLVAAQRAHDQGDSKAAERIFRQVLAVDPTNAHAARTLGALLGDSGRPAEAIQVLSPAAKRYPSDAQLLARLGRCLWMARKFHPATSALERALALDPGQAAARTWLADCRLSDLRPADALALVTQVLASNPKDAAAHVVAGRANMVIDRYPEGIKHFRAVVDLTPSETAICHLALALKQAGQIDEAIVEFDRGLERWPASAQLLGGKCDAQSAVGDQEAARATIRSALDRGILHPQMAIVSARMSKGKEHRGAAIELVERTLAQVGPEQGPRAALFLALGSLRDAAGEYDEAFEAFRTGNDLYPGRFDAAEYARSVEKIIETFSALNLARLARASDKDPVPVFIVGMPRSGTSLVEQILASHPAVHGAGELDNLPRLLYDAPRLLGLAQSPSFPSFFLTLGASQLDRLARRYLDRLHALGPGAQRVTDKLPGNSMFLGPIELLFPGARVIHCVRNPLDTCLSCYMTELGLTLMYKTRQSDLAAAYRGYRRIMEHWRSVLRVPMLDIVYEDLVTDMPTNVRRLIEFVGLPWDDRCMRPHENRRVVQTASIDQVRRPVYDSSVNRWRHYERHLGPLIEGLREYL